MQFYDLFIWVVIKRLFPSTLIMGLMIDNTSDISIFATFHMHGSGPTSLISNRYNLKQGIGNYNSGWLREHGYNGNKTAGI